MPVWLELEQQGGHSHPGGQQTGCRFSSRMAASSIPKALGGESSDNRADDNIQKEEHLRVS